MDSSSPTNQGIQPDPPRNEDDEDTASVMEMETVDALPGACSAQEHYVINANSKKLLYLMCIGLNNDGGTALFDISEPPFTKLKKRAVKPKRDEYAAEVIRRANIIFNHNKAEIPKAANWGTTKSTEWLLTNPIADEDSISFLKREVQKLRNIAANALSESDEAEFAGGGPWRGNVPYLRLILCIIQDDIKQKYCRHAAVMTRQELDGRNAEDRPQTAFEMIADRWNDPNFNPTAPASDCHEEFSHAIPCGYATVNKLMPASAQKVKDHIAAMRTDLTRIIGRWEQSGQGDGGRHASDDENSENSGVSGREEGDVAPVPFGALRNRPARALSCRASFLGGRPSYLLYFWEVADSHQILQTTIQRIDASAAASDASSVPTSVTYSTTPSSTRRRLHTNNDSAITNNRDILTLSRSIQKLNESETVRSNMVQTHEDARMRAREEAENTRSTRRRIDNLEDQARDFRRKFAESEDILSRSAIFYREEAERLMDEITLLKQSLLGTPMQNNRTPQRDD